MKFRSKNAEHSCIVLYSGEPGHIPMQTVRVMARIQKKKFQIITTLE